jgi:hypothetical protein
MEGPEDAGDRLREMGWRQGDLVPASKNAAVLGASIDRRPPGPADRHWLVVLTQDCDLLRSTEKEPYVELIAGRVVEKEDALCQNGRNPRALQLPFGSIWIEFRIHDRFRVDKFVLADFPPDAGCALSEANRGVLRQWIARRYLRAPFPDEFNRRWMRHGKQIDRLLKGTSARRVSCIYIAGADAELGVKTPYRIQVLIVVPDGRSDDDDFEMDFESCLGGCQGVQVDNISTLAENDVTLDMLRSYKRLDVDYRSLPDEETTDKPPEQVDVP